MSERKRLLYPGMMGNPELQRGSKRENKARKGFSVHKEVFLKGVHIVAGWGVEFKEFYLNKLPCGKGHVERDDF